MINAWTKPGWCNWVWPGSGRAVLDQMIKRGLYEEVTTEQTRWEGASYVMIWRKGFADRGNNKYKDCEAALCSASSRNWKSQESGDRRWGQRGQQGQGMLALIGAGMGLLQMFLAPTMMVMWFPTEIMRFGHIPLSYCKDAGWRPKSPNLENPFPPFQAFLSSFSFPEATPLEPTSSL